LDKLKNISDLLKDFLPSLLSSKEGLSVACGVFNILDAKERKVVVKSMKDVIKEMLSNKIAYLFIAHIINTLDDTTIIKKKIITVPLINNNASYIGVNQKFG
jgi:hypothetical protein